MWVPGRLSLKTYRVQGFYGTELVWKHIFSPSSYLEYILFRVQDILIAGKKKHYITVTVFTWFIYFTTDKL